MAVERKKIPFFEAVEIFLAIVRGSVVPIEKESSFIE